MKVWHPAAAASFMRVSSRPGKPVLGYWTLSEQVQRIIFPCASLLAAFFPPVIHLSFTFRFPFSSLKAGSPYATLSLMVKWWLCRGVIVSLSLEDVTSLGGKKYAKQKNPGGVEEFAEVYRVIHNWRLFSSWQHFTEKGSRITTGSGMDASRRIADLRSHTKAYRWWLHAAAWT